MGIFPCKHVLVLLFNFKIPEEHIGIITDISIHAFPLIIPDISPKTVRFHFMMVIALPVCAEPVNKILQVIFK